MAFPDDPLEIAFELALGADLTDPSTWTWTDITDYCRPEARIRAGRSDWQGSASSAQLTVTVDNADGRFTRLNPLGAWYGQLKRDTPIRVTVTDGVIDPSTRFVGYIAELPPRWSEGYHDRWVPITANGVLRRLDQIHITDSTLKRFVLGTSKLRAYWPLEDGDNATSGASAVAGQSPTWANSATEDVSWSSASGLPGSEPLPSLGEGAQIGARVTGGTAGSWIVAMAAKGELDSDSSDGEWLSARVEVTGSNVYYVVTGTDEAVLVRAVDASTGSTKAEVDSSDLLGTLSLIGAWHTVAVAVSGTTEGSSGSIIVAVFVDGQLGDTVATSGTGLHVGRVDRIYYPHAFDTDDIQSMQVGHLTVWSNVSMVLGTDDVWRIADFHDAAMGYQGETAGDRIRRVCAEENISCEVTEGTVVGNLPASTRMGPQEPNSITSLLRDAESADGGLQYETTDAGIGYVARSALYDRAVDDPVLDLDFEQGHIDARTGFEPADDDQQVANEVTVTRSGGSSFTVSRVDDGELVYPRSSSLELYADGSTQHQAGWRTHLGTAEEYRYPVIGVDLARNADLIGDWVGCGIGSRVSAANPPPGHPPDDLDLFLMGYTETFANFSWKVALNCASARPYQVGQFPGTLTTVTEGFEDSTLAFTVTDGGDAAWSRTQDDAHHGSWSWRSGVITDSETSDAVVTVPDGCTRVRFWYRTSSEGGFDFFRVIVGGSTELEASGVSGWVLSDYIAVTPGGSITFRYVKDSSRALFGDRVYVDDVQFEGGTGTTGSERARADTAGSELAADIDADDTTASVATTQGPLWTTDDDELPFDVAVGGEVVTVTAITGAASPQTFTITRSVNGVTKSHSAGDAVALAHPMILALGD